MIETILLILLLLLVGVFGVVLGVHLQAAKTKTDCGCGGGATKQLSTMIRSLQLRLDKIEGNGKAPIDSVE
jgi:hypothetical protein